VNKVPEFEVSHLVHGAGLKIYIYAENAKGMSDPVVLEESMPASTSHIIQPADVSKAVMVSSSNLEDGNSQLTIIISVAAGGCVVCLSLLIAILLCGRKRIEVLREKRGGNCDIGEHQLINSKYSQGTSECSGVQDNLRGYGSNPDLIPQTNYIYGGENYTTDVGSHLVYNRKGLESSEGSGPLPLALISTNLPPPSGYGEISAGSTPHPSYSSSSSRLPESQVQRGPSSTQRGPSSTQRGSISTLGRKLQRIPESYPLYHTCTRKKRVTIVESKKGESEV